jgi:hypothetical protein
MREEELRKILLVKAVEDADRDGTLLPAADRAAAGREAMREAPGAEPVRLLAARARSLLKRITARHPFVARVMTVLGPSPGMQLAVVLAGFLLGAALPVLDGTHRINVLAFPLLGVVGWNLIVYIVLAVSWLRRGGSRGDTPIRAALASAGSWLAGRTIARSRAFNAPLAEALQGFAREWYAASRALLVARAARGLHLAAAALAAGLVASLYVRGIAFDYRAGWESTFLDAESARATLAMLYAPASWITGIALPGTAELEAARWRAGAAAGGENAARWIHLIAATALIYVIVPRLVLAAAAAARAARLALRAPQPESLTTYFRAAFASVEGAVPRAQAIVLPYARELTPAALAKLVAWVQSNAGGPVDVTAREGVPYGEEDRYLESLAAAGEADVVVMPFSLATTPEAENHGAVLAAARDHLAARRPGARLMVVVDEAPYAGRMSAAPERIVERREAWRVFVYAHGLEAHFASLAP